MMSSRSSRPSETLSLEISNVDATLGVWMSHSRISRRGVFPHGERDASELNDTWDAEESVDLEELVERAVESGVHVIPTARRRSIMAVV